MTSVLLLLLSAGLRAFAVNPCLDPDDDAFQCLGYETSFSGTELYLTTCAITNDDVEAGDLASCFDSIGRGEIAGLGLSENVLTTLPEGIFENFTALVSLHLTANDLTTLPEGIFQNLAALEILDLSENDLTTLPEGIFQDLSSLDTLSLADNELTTLPEGIFQDLSSLAELNLVINDLTTLPEGIFQDLTSLIYLWLDDLECQPTIGDDSTDVEVADSMSAEPTFGTECGCSVPDVVNVCGEGYECTPGSVGYTCAAAAPAATPAPATAGTTATEWTTDWSADPTPTPFVATPSSGGESISDYTPIIAGVVSAVGGVMLVALGVWLTRRRTAQRKKVIPEPPPPYSDFEHHEQWPEVGSHKRVWADGSDGRPLHGQILGSTVHAHTSVEAEESHGEGIGSTSTSTAPAASAPAPVVEPVHTSPGQATLSSERGGDMLARGIAREYPVRESMTASSSTSNMSTIEQAELDQLHQGQRVARAASVADDGTSTAGCRGSRDDLGLGEAVMDAAIDLAHHCIIPGVSEAASVLTTLVKLVSDSRDTGSDARLRQCRSILRILERAGKVAGKGGETTGQAERDLIGDVHDAIFDLVELIKTYRSKNKLSKVLTSTLFKRRQEELDAVVDRAIIRLQLGLQLHAGQALLHVVQDVSEVKEGIHVYKGSIAEVKSQSLAEARSARRQRKLHQVEIPKDQVFVTDELLGSGGFGQVYLADLNGRNAAAKVLFINHELGKCGDDEVLDGEKGGHAKLDRERRQRKAFLRELHAMIRLRSPHTVSTYGAVTSLPDRLILFMELLAGGDLRTLLKNSEHPLPEEQARRVIGDICAGMTFLHGKATIHGDLKSANVLLDGDGRAKIGDFGTSRWSQHTNSTGLATYTSKSGQNTQMSLAWSAPEVLDATGNTYASDVYSFGIVAWEVLSRELPWANETHPRDVYIRVVLKGLRPELPTDTPTDMADMVRACWAGEPKARPAFSSIMNDIKANGWKE